MFNLNASKIVEIGTRWTTAERGESRPPAAGIAAAGAAAPTAESQSDENRRPEPVKPVQAGGSARYEPPPPLFLKRYGVIEGTFQPYLDIVMHKKQDFAFRVYGRHDSTTPAAARSAYAAGARADAARPTLATVA